MLRQNVIVLGAGLTGLSVAYHMENSCAGDGRYRIFEKGPVPGGLCCSEKINSFTFDRDGHLLHFKHDYARELVKNLLGANLVQHNRSSWVFFSGRYIPYPFQGSLFFLPSQVRRECLLDFINAFAQNECGFLGGEGIPFDEWIIKVFGRGIAQYFMLPYNHKFWTVPLSELTSEWVDDFIPVPGLEQVLSGAFAENSFRYGYNAFFWYPAKGGVEELVKAFLGHTRSVETSFEAERINPANKTVVFKNGKVVFYDKLVSTLPLPEMLYLVDGLPLEITKELKSLRWTSVFNLNLGIKKRPFSRMHWVYFPEDEFVFFRVGFPHNFSTSLVPEGMMSVYAEVSYSKEKGFDKKKLPEQIKADLIKSGILSSADEIVAENINDIKYGYVIYDQARIRAVKKILRYLESLHIYSCGRYGKWGYMSMEDSVLDGKAVAEALRMR